MLVELRDALRGLRKAPVLSAVVIATLAVGIGANTALFSILNAVLVRPLPFVQSDKILSVGMKLRRGEIGSQAAVQDFQAWMRGGRVFNALAAFRQDYGNLGGGNKDPEWLAGARVSRGFFSVMGIPPGLGRSFTEDEDRPDGHNVAIISDAMWRHRFNADPKVVDRQISVEGKQYQVVGVMPPAFRFPEDAEFWLPFQLADEPPGSMAIEFVSVIGRISPSSTIEQAQLETAALSRQLDPARSADWLRGADVDVVTLHDRLYAGRRPVLTLLMGVVGMVLLIACGNVAGLLLARASGRRRELATRAALGATPSRVALLLLLEGLLLAVGGALVGGFIAWGGVRAVLQLAPEIAGGMTLIPIDWAVLGFGLAVALLTGLLCSLGPALMASRASMLGVATFGEEPVGRRPWKNGPRWVLVVIEFAAAIVLLVGAGLFLKGFAQVASVDPGFRAANVLLVDLNLPEARYPSNTSLRRDFFDRLVARARSIPGVRAATIATAGPFQRVSGGVQIEVGGNPQALELVRTAIDVDYFRVLGVAVAGRMFGPDDRVGSRLVAIINSSMARSLFGAAEPVGRILPAEVTEGQTVEVIGVSANIRQLGVHRQPAAQIYLSLAQVPRTPRSLLVLGDGDLRLLIEPIRHAVLELDPAQPLSSARPLGEMVAEQVAPERTISSFVALFAGVALGLAVVGLYGLTAYVVSLRSREIAVRMALGADRVQVMGLVVGQAMKVALTGIVGGTLAALALSKLTTGLLPAVNPVDPFTYVIAASILGGAAFLASYSLARRAARIDPVVNLRAS